MEFNELCSILEKNRDSEKATQMSAYMRNLFAFLGLPMPKRKELCKEFLNSIKKEKQIDWDFINICFEKEYREYQYLAMDYLILMKKYLVADDIPKIKKLILTKSWWDSVDILHKAVGHIALNYPDVNKIILEWSQDENFWLRRVAIDHQLSRKDQTNTELLEKVIVNNLGQSEFFINKAIGWSLRDYSKTNPEWVRNFIERYKDKLAPLSIKEGSKYI